MALAPRGVPVTCAFFASDPAAAADFDGVPKVKAVDVHGSQPWVAAADETGQVTVWDYARATAVLSFSVQEVKDQQAALVAAAEAQASAAGGGAPAARLAYSGTGAAAAAVPPAGGGIGSVESRLEAAGLIANALQVAATGAGASPGAAATAKSFRARIPHLFSPFGAKSSGAADIPGDVAAGAAGSVRSVCFADGGSGTPWLTVLCEHRTLLVDCRTRGVIDVPHAALATEADLAATPAGLIVARRGAGVVSSSASSKSAPAVRCLAPLGGDALAFGCEDGTVRIWHAGLDAVVQVVRLGDVAAGGRHSVEGPPSTKPITALLFTRLGSNDTGDDSGSEGFDSPATSLDTADLLGGGTRAPRAGALGCLVAGTSDGWLRGWPVVERGYIATGEAYSGLLGVTPRSSSALPGLATALAPMPVAASSLTLLPLPPLHLKGNGGIADLSACALSGKLVVKTEEKAVATLQLTAAAGVAVSTDAAAPVHAAATVLVGRVSTSSDASETGSGSPMTAAVPLGAHPAFPPHAVLAASKGPHIEIAIPGVALQTPGAPTGAPASSGGSSLSQPVDTSAAILYDLRTARPGLPKKCKVYTLRRHPRRPEVLVAGTNIGVFVLEVAAAAAATLPPVVALPLPPAAAGAARVLHLSASSSLLVTDFSTRPPTDMCPTAVVQAETHLLTPAVTPVRQPPVSLGPSPATPGAQNAWAALAASVKGVTAANVAASSGAGWLPGSRGARLSVSGSGRHLAVVWPEHKCYAIYRLTMPALGENEEASSTGPAWYAEYVDGGAGAEVAWAGRGAAWCDGHSGKAEAESQAEDGAVSAVVDRFALLVPGSVVAAGRGPMGGGMPIGSSVSKAGGSSSSGKGKGAGAGGTQGYVSLPPALSIRELDVPTSAEAPLVKPRVVAPDVALPGDALAVWGGGPALAVAVGQESGLAAATATAATTTPSPAALATAQLLFYPWSVQPPAAPPISAADGSAPPPTAPHIGQKRVVEALHRLGTSSSTASPYSSPLGPPLPAPSWYGAAGGSGCGVVWDAYSRRVAIAAPGLLTMLGVPPGGSSSGSSGWIILAQLAVQAGAVSWVAPGVLAVTSAPTSAVYAAPFAPPRRQLVFTPPLSAAFAGEAGAGSKASAAALDHPIVVNLSTAGPEAPLLALGDALLAATWRGAGVSTPLGGGALVPGGVTLTMLPGIGSSPALRALAAVAGDVGAGLSVSGLAAALGAGKAAAEPSAVTTAALLAALPSEVTGVLNALDTLWGPGAAHTLLSASPYARASLVAAVALLTSPEGAAPAPPLTPSSLFDVLSLGGKATVLLCGLRRYPSVVNARAAVLACAAGALAACAGAAAARSSAGTATLPRAAVEAALACAALYEAATAIPSEVPSMLAGDAAARAAAGAVASALAGEAAAAVVAACAAVVTAPPSGMVDKLQGVAHAFR